MKKTAALLLAALLLLTLAACGNREEEQEEGGYLLYFLADPEKSGGGDAITGVQVALELPEGADLTAQATAVVEQLIAGVQGYESPIGRDIQLRGLTIQGRRAYVDFSYGYASLAGIDLSLADYCVTLSLTSLEGISAVSITAGGRELFRHSSEVLMGRDVLFSSMEDVIETVPVTLYFQNEAGELVPEERQLDLYEGQTLAESLISALLEGPRDRALSPLIPEDFEVNAIRVENRICYLSISHSALETLPADREEQEKILLSIGQSIYSMDTVDEIYILADGEELEYFGEVPMDLIRIRPEEPEE